MIGIGADFDIDGQYIVVIGFSNGAIEARKHRTGDIIYKSTVSSG